MIMNRIRSNYEEMEVQMKLGNMNVGYNIIKSNFGKSRPKNNVIKDKAGKELIESRDIARRWREYLEDLYRRGEIVQDLKNMELMDEDELGYVILKTEYDKALKVLKNNKSVGIDMVPAEFLKAMGEKMQQRLYRLVCRIYDEVEVPEDFERSVIVAIPKRVESKVAEGYRKINSDLGKNRGTREAILTLRMIIEERMRGGSC